MRWPKTTSTGSFNPHALTSAELSAWLISRKDTLVRQVFIQHDAAEAPCLPAVLSLGWNVSAFGRREEEGVVIKGSDLPRYAQTASILPNASAVWDKCVFLYEQGILVLQSFCRQV